MRRKREACLTQEYLQKLLLVMPLLNKHLLRTDQLGQEERMPLSHLYTLSLLSERGSMSVSAIASYLGIAKPNMTPLLDTLEEDGLIIRTHDQMDRRMIKVTLSERGEERLGAICTSLSKTASSPSSALHLSKQQVVVLSSAIDTLLPIAQQL